jgi:hypothetical protein
LFVACYNPPDCTVLHADLSSVFSSFGSVVLVGDLNSNHTVWNCVSADRHGQTLLSYCTSSNTVVNYPDHPTYFHTNFQHSVLDFALSKHSLLPKALSVPALSSDHNPVVFKILSCPSVSEPSPILDYKHANWPLFRSTLDQLIVTISHISDLTDPEHTIQDFTSSVRQAAYTATPHLTVRSHHLPLSPSLVNLMKFKNCYRRRCQSSGFRLFHLLHQLLSRVLTSGLTQLQNSEGPLFWALYTPKLENRQVLHSPYSLIFQPYLTTVCRTPSATIRIHHLS